MRQRATVLQHDDGVGVGLDHRAHQRVLIAGDSEATAHESLEDLEERIAVRLARLEVRPVLALDLGVADEDDRRISTLGGESGERRDRTGVVRDIRAVDRGALLAARSGAP